MNQQQNQGGQIGWPRRRKLRPDVLGPMFKPITVQGFLEIVIVGPTSV